jgi:hypothetical protein
VRKRQGQGQEPGERHIQRERISEKEIEDDSVTKTTMEIETHQKKILIINMKLISCKYGAFNLDIVLTYKISSKNYKI